MTELRLLVICQSVAFKYEIVDMIDKGYLVGVEQFLVKIESLDLSRCRTQAGDLNGRRFGSSSRTRKAIIGWQMQH